MSLLKVKPNPMVNGRPMLYTDTFVIYHVDDPQIINLKYTTTTCEVCCENVCCCHEGTEY